MKVKIGPFRYAPFPTYEWERSYLAWRYGFEECHDAIKHTSLDRVVIKTLDALGDILAPVNNWWCNRPREIKIRIDKYDTWNMDHTLALIILPMLKQLKATTHGAPHVDDADVPVELRSTSAPPKENEWDADDNHFKRWDWVLGELIWAFEQQTLEDDGEQFHHNSDNEDIVLEPVEGENYSRLKGVIKDPSKPAPYYDIDGHTAHEKRKRRAMMLFGKYYFGLWT